MNKFEAGIARRVAFFVALVTALVMGTESYAQSDMNEIKSAIDGYHAALGSLDTSKMEPLWAHDDYVMLINPQDKSVSVGAAAVKKSWDSDFSAASELKVTQTDGPHIHVKGDVAWAIGIATAVVKLKSGAAFSVPTYEIDVFEKRDGQWLLVSHAALGVPK